MAALLYGPMILEAAASGDLATMKRVAKEAEEHLQKHGYVVAALEALRLEIAKAESKAAQ